MRAFIVGLTAVVLAGCGGGSAPGGAPVPVRGSANVITEAELSQGNYANALEAITRLRPMMLVARGTSTSTESSQQPIVFYLDDVRLNDRMALQSIPVERVSEIRFINARDATTRWGTDHGSGAILVTTRK